MIPQAQLLDYFVELTDTLIDGFDVVDFLHNLTVKAATASGADAVGLVLADHQGRVRYMASNNEEGKLLELLQIQNDEGPCLDAIVRGVPVVNADLGQASTRWPTFITGTGPLPYTKPLTECIRLLSSNPSSSSGATSCGAWARCCRLSSR